MARAKEKKKVKEQQRFRFPLERTNYLIIGVGILMLIVGFVIMAIPDDPDAFISRTLAPIVLVIAFLIVIPYGIMYGGARGEKPSEK